MLETNRIIHGQTQGFLSKNKILYRLFMAKHNKGLFMTKHKSFWGKTKFSTDFNLISEKTIPLTLVSDI